MDLKGVFASVVGGEKAQKAESYLAIKLASNSVTAAVWTVISGKVEVGNVGASAIFGETFEELLSASDKAVSAALGGNIAVTDKAVFALPNYWIVEGKVIPEKLKDLRRLCKELGLQPVGFVPLTEALENYYKETEGAPLTAILVGIDGDRGVLTMYRAGRDMGTVPLAMEEGENIAQAIEKSLKRFNESEVFPSRIILYDGKSDLEAVAKVVTAYPWTQKASFLHFPKVEILYAEMVVRAVAIAGGSEMGGEVSNEEIREETHEEIQKEELVEVAPEEAGFKITDGDIDIDTPKIEMKVPKITLPKIKLPKFNFKFNLLIIPVILVALFGLIGVATYMVPKVEVGVTIVPKPFDREMEITVDSSSIVETSELGTKKGVATGNKLVGTKASGTVTIYSASSAKNLVTGTVLTSSDGLKFTLDQDTAVASASDFLTPSTVTAKITAADIGDKYNLASGAKFTISGLSDSYLAKSESAFSGGSSHQAVVVTKEDQTRLLATLSAELAQKAVVDLQNKVGAGQKLLPNAITSVIDKKKFSKDVDSEADTVSLDLTMNFKGVVFSEDEVINEFKQKYASDIPGNYLLTRENGQIEVKNAKTDKSGKMVLAIRLSASLMPMIDPTGIVNKISGKSVDYASKYISGIEGVSGVSGITFEVKPLFFEPIIKMWLPFRKESISVRLR